MRFKSVRINNIKLDTSEIVSHILSGSGFIFGGNPLFPDRFFNTINAENVTDLVLVPHTVRRILRMLEQGPQYSIENLSCITSSSDFLTEDILEGIFRHNSELTVFNIYGLTEAGRACYRKIAALDTFSGSIGCPAPSVKIELDGSPDQPGGIVIRGPNVMKGYFRGISDERIMFDQCDRVETGDLGYYDGNKEIILVGRRDHMINLMGAKIHPIEIETIAMQIPQIKDARARLAGEDGAPSVHLDVVCSASDSCIPDLQRRLRNQLQHMFVPTKIVQVRTIERTEIGSKTLR